MKRWGTLVALSLLLSGCGYIAETQAPSLKLPTPVRDLTAVERGSKIIVDFTPPIKTTEGLDLKDDPRLVAYIDDRPFELSELRKGHAELDAAPFYGKTVRVTIKAYNEKHHDAGFSNVITMPVVTAVPVPANPKVKAVAEGTQVSWDSTEKQFIIYRQGPDETILTKLDDAKSSPYIDKNTEYGKAYRYAIRALSQSSESEMVNVDPFPFTPEDKFAPAIPVALAAVVSTQSVELVWDRSTEPDLAAYRIYRDAGTGQFERIGQSTDAPSFSDKTIEKSKRYRYAVTAIDKAGNESGLSEATEVAIP